MVGGEILNADTRFWIGIGQSLCGVTACVTVASPRPGYF
jgi:hypothetical protein